jgi:hypothetical protein
MSNYTRIGPDTEILDASLPRLQRKLGDYAPHEYIVSGRSVYRGWVLAREVILLNPHHPDDAEDVLLGIHLRFIGRLPPGTCSCGGENARCPERDEIAAVGSACDGTFAYAQANVAIDASREWTAQEFCARFDGLLEDDFPPVDELLAQAVLRTGSVPLLRGVPSVN